MNNKEEAYIGSVEQEINSMIENTDKEIFDLHGNLEHLLASDQNILKLNKNVLTLKGCVLYLAKEIDKLAKYIK